MKWNGIRDSGENSNGKKDETSVSGIKTTNSWMLKDVENERRRHTAEHADWLSLSLSLSLETLQQTNNPNGGYDTLYIVYECGQH